MPWDFGNHCEQRYPWRLGYYRSPCSVPRRKTSPCYAEVAAFEVDLAKRQGKLFDPSRILFDTAHTWNDGASGLRGGTCIRCGKTLSQILVPYEEGFPDGSDHHLARALRTGD